MLTHLAAPTVQTIYVGPSNTRPPRIRATGNDGIGRALYDVPGSFNGHPLDLHRAIAQEWIADHWPDIGPYTLVSGHLPHGYVHLAIPARFLPVNL